MGSLAKTQAGINATVAFFEPEIVTVPCKGCPPSILITFSIVCPPPSE